MLDAHPVADIFSKLPHEWSLFHDPEFGERMPAAGADFDDPKFLEAFIIRNTRQPADGRKLLFPTPSPLTIMARMMRAILLASLTAASFFDLRASNASSHGEVRPGLAARITAPMTRKNDFPLGRVILLAPVPRRMSA